jgi:hypothetical protein
MEGGRGIDGVLLEQVASKPGGGIESCYNAAFTFAKAAALSSTTRAIRGPQTSSRIYWDRAVELLRRAVAMGFRELNQLAKDPDFHALHNRPAVKLLLLDLAMPDEPFTW